MPIYEYRCSSCGKTFELLRPINKASEPAACPYCGSSETERAISLFAAVSRGEGGTTRSLGGSPCTGCTATTCTSCGR
ncbi:MAG: zinc ribbon domain-containing protein [Anaerolineae bacterium]|nr:zinc ribbon domain-containing protein [Anaerolineae bacterium]MDW8101675.1 zinc ribbon domain-containing protein [Anaerolineae bacterium]